MVCGTEGDAMVKSEERKSEEIIRLSGLSFVREIGKLSARALYYYEKHKARWELRYGKRYPEYKGVLGTMAGVRWISNG